MAREMDRKLRYQYQVSVTATEGVEGGYLPVPQGERQQQRPPPAQPPTEEVQQQELLHRITNQLENLSVHLVQGTRVQPQNQDANRVQRRNAREFLCYNCGETRHGMYCCPHPRRNPVDAYPPRRPRQQVSPPRDRPPPAPPLQPIQILRPHAPPQPQAQIPPLPAIQEDRAVNVLT